ncbi:MAG: hypothetical protein RL335_247, partial [Bacteroidota bacterium]
MKYLFVAALLTSMAVQGNDSTVKSTLILPKGFSSSVFYDNLGRARHLTVAPNGDVYVKLERLKDGKGIYRLTDVNKDGIAEKAYGFADYIGTGITIQNGYLYASSNTSVFRYKL